MHRGATRQQILEAFSRQVFAASPQTKAWLLERSGKEILSPVVSMDHWFFLPTALPPLLRVLEVDDIVEILYGRLKDRVLLFFDWSRFEQTVREHGCTLTWVRPQPVDGKTVHEVVGKRTPCIGHSNGQGLRLGKMFVAEILAKGNGHC